MYSKVTYQVKCKDGLTEAITSVNGVKQGCVLSPILFNLFLHDLPEIFDTNCCPFKLHDFPLNCILYADDMILFSETASGMQNCLDKLLSYCNKMEAKSKHAKDKNHHL
jgi:hypothetical protein